MARVTTEPAMNPVLLKPDSDHYSNVVLMGRSCGVRWRRRTDDWRGGRLSLRR